MHSPLIEFEYHLQGDTLGAMRWGAWGAAMLAAALLLAAGARHLQATDNQLALVRGQLDPLREQAVAAGASAPPGVMPAVRDFTAALPDTPPVADVVQRLRPDGHTAIVALTHDPKLDDLALMEALKSPAFYVGAIGSRVNQAKRRARLKEHFDLTEAQLDRLHGPVGLHIGARTPPEIALAILAHMTAERYGVTLSSSAQPADRGEAGCAV